MTAGTAPLRRADLRRLPRAYLVAAAVLPLILLALWGALLVARGAGPAGGSIGSMAPDFGLTDLQGNQVRLADLSGRPVMLNFWASWCVPCIEEFPLLERALDDHRGHGLALVGVVYDDNAESARAFMERFDAAWPALMDPKGGVAARYGIFGPPETFFISRDGTIVARQIGLLSESALDAKLAAILHE